MFPGFAAPIDVVCPFLSQSKLFNVNTWTGESLKFLQIVFLSNWEFSLPDAILGVSPADFLYLAGAAAVKAKLVVLGTKLGRAAKSSMCLL